MIRLEDNSPMPWGRYKGVSMQFVPADYMFWFWTDGGRGGPGEERTDCPVADYIRRNIAAYETDYPDGIWR